MLQQSGTLCIALTRLAQWPNLTRGVSWAPIRLSGASLLGRISAFPTVNFSSTMAQAQKPKKDVFVPETATNNAVSKSTLGNKNNTQSAIERAQNVNELLELVDRQMSGDDVKALVSKLAAWEAAGNVKTEDFQHDPRFIQAKKMLHRPTFLKQLQNDVARSNNEDGSYASDGELRAVLKVKSLSRAMELAHTFNWKQRLSVLKSLAASSHRPLPLINSLAHGINKDIRNLDMKEVTDLLYSMSKLNYMNTELLGNACNVLRSLLKNTTKHAVVGSAITSLRKLQFRDEELLEQLSLWLEKNLAGFQSPSSLIYTLALQNYLPSNHKTLFALLWQEFKNDTRDYNEAVSVVWSFLVLQAATPEQIEYILNPTFIRDLDLEPVWVPTAKKLLNLNGAALTLIENYKGPLLPNHMLEDRVYSESAEKRILVSKISDLLFRKMDPNLFATSVPTKMGFSIDLVCNLDKNGTPVPLKNTTPGTSRVAVLVLTYRECSQPKYLPTGYKVLEKRLLEKAGYKVIEIPFNVFSSDKTSKDSHTFFKEALQHVLSKKS